MWRVSASRSRSWRWGGHAVSFGPLSTRARAPMWTPVFSDASFVLGSYKTEPCPKPPRLCRQGYACPHYHNSRDRRRSPRRFQYRSTPCPSVKHGDEWGEPARCDSGDSCQYCHSRAEQQFHPEVRGTRVGAQPRVGGGLPPLTPGPWDHPLVLRFAGRIRRCQQHCCAHNRDLLVTG